MPICLTPQFDGDPIKLDKAILLIGRHPSCDVVLLSSRKVSRMHCCIAQAGDRLLIRDLGSTNGVTVNGDRVEESEIRQGDEVIIGDLEFTVGNGSNEVRTRRVAPQGAAEAVVFTGMDSAETPVADNDPLPRKSEYAIVVESSEIVGKAKSNGDDSSYVEISEADIDIL